MSCVGHPQLKTPHMDRLAEEGVLFENAFVTTSICAANRACILAGQHTRTTGIKDFARPFSAEALDRTYPMLLKDAGYRVGFLGKWGVGANTDEDLALPAERFDYWKGFKQQGKFFHEVEGETRHLTDLMADWTEEFLDGCAEGEPFCLSVSFKAPHGPWQHFDPRFKDEFTGEDLPPLPVSFREEVFDALPGLVKSSLNAQAGWGEETVWVRDRDPMQLREMRAQYYRLILGVDRSVGRMMQALRDKGVDQNTVVILTGDNGHFLWEKGLFGKWLMYEESIRVPLIVRDPRMPEKRKGKRCQEMALSIDVAPTILALAGQRVPDFMQGRDLAPLLRGDPLQWRQDWFYEHTFTLAPPRIIPKSQGVRTKRWKYIKYLDPNPYYEELFDLEADTEEMENRVDDPRCAEVLGKLRKRYEYYRKSLPDNNPDRVEYGHYRDDVLNQEPADVPRDLGEGRRWGQSFLAEGERIHELLFPVATWGKGAGEIKEDLIAELREEGPAGELLASHRIQAGSYGDNQQVTVPFDVPVIQGQVLLFSVCSAEKVESKSLAWWGCDESTFPHGEAFMNGEPQEFDMGLTVTYKDPEGFVPTERYFQRKRQQKEIQRNTFRLKQGQALPHHRSPNVVGKSIEIEAKVNARERKGVLVVQGGTANGYALYLDENLCLAMRHEGSLSLLRSEEMMPLGGSEVLARIDKDGSAELKINNVLVAAGRLPGALEVMPGDGLEAGGDHDTPVGPYEPPNLFQGTLAKVVVRIGG